MTPTPDNLPFLFAAFAVVWVVFFVYAAYMSWRRQSVQRELRDFQQSSSSGQPPDLNASDDDPV